LTESKQKVFPSFKEFFYIFYQEETKQEPDKMSQNVLFTEKEIKNREKLSTNNEVDLIEKTRAIKRWKQSFNYYWLHPEKFKFGIRNLK